MPNLKRLRTRWSRTQWKLLRAQSLHRAISRLENYERKSSSYQYSSNFWQLLFPNNWEECHQNSSLFFPKNNWQCRQLYYFLEQINKMDGLKSSINGYRYFSRHSRIVNFIRPRRQRKRRCNWGFWNIEERWIEIEFPEGNINFSQTNSICRRM
jgi:hypothetical protein